MMIFASILLTSCSTEQPPETTKSAAGTEETPVSTTPEKTPTPVQKKNVNDAIEATLAFASYKCTINVALATTVGESAVNTSADYEITVNGDKAIGSRTATVNDASAVVNVYTADGETYVKGAPEGAAAKDYNLKAQIAPIVVKLPAAVVEAADVKTEAVGESVSISLTAEQFKEIYADFVSSVTSTAAAAGASDVVVSDPAVKVDYADSVISYALSFKLSMKVGEATSVSAVSAKVSFAGEAAPEVSAPADLADYTKL